LGNDPTRHLPKEMQMSVDWRFRKGDFRREIEKVLEEEPGHGPDYLFLDSYHSKGVVTFVFIVLFMFIRSIGGLYSLLNYFPRLRSILHLGTL
jgi:hypothetical protein